MFCANVHALGTSPCGKELVKDYTDPLLLLTFLLYWRHPVFLIICFFDIWTLYLLLFFSIWEALQNLNIFSLVELLVH